MSNEQPHITILLRVHRREELLKRCVDSIKVQSHYNLSIFCSFEDDEDLELVKKYGCFGFSAFKVERNESEGDCWFNLYLNTLKDNVNDGWFIVVDSDDWLADNTVLDKLSYHLTNEDEFVIFQYQRKNAIKPSMNQIAQKRIVSGHIDMSCFALHSKHKNIANFDNSENTDYKFIKEVSQKLPTKFIPLLVTKTDRRSRGKN